MVATWAVHSTAFWRSMTTVAASASLRSAAKALTVVRSASIGPITGATYVSTRMAVAGTARAAASCCENALLLLRRQAAFPQQERRLLEGRVGRELVDVV